MNYQVDIILIGDSKSGHTILDKIAASKPTIKLAFISKEFKSTTTRDYLNVEYFKDEVKLVSYKHRLFCCHLNGDNVYSTHLIIASGLNYKPLIINNTVVPCVFNTVDDVPKLAKDQPALVVYNNESDSKLVLDVAKKYKHVYVCTNELNIFDTISMATRKKLEQAKNIVILPNTSIKKVIYDENALHKVELDNYSEVTCSAIYVKTESIPAIEFVPRNILHREDNYPAINDNCESILVPCCFVVGTCLKKYTKAMEQRLIELILKDF